MRKTPTADDLTAAANTIRGLAMDGVQKASSGHPGMPMGMADVAAVLYLKHLKHCPDRPDWPDRDRFVLSAGHGSMLLYSVLHLSGYDLPMEELQAFRQWGSRTPGHPEFMQTPGVETTTGPLGQGCGNAVGMALAERMLAARFNTPLFDAVDHYTYVLASDGDLMEGVSHEAFALAGHLRLSRLIVFYDCNGITIEGSTRLAYSDDVRKRFQGYHWDVLEIDAHDPEQIDKAIRRAKRRKERPTLVICRSHIGYGSPAKQDTAAAHGEPLGAEEVAAAKQTLGLPADTPFHVSDRVRDLFAARRAALKRKAHAWQRRFQDAMSRQPQIHEQWTRCMQNVLPENLEEFLPVFSDKPLATRAASGKVIQALAQAVPQLVGGSADLAPSTKTLIEGAADVGAADYGGRNLRFGVREHGMAAILNGMALHGGWRPFGATFFVFLDYCRPSVRLAALMQLPVVYVFTHDSFYVGEDGPTHQPIEHLASLRCMPNIAVLRPCDASETAAAWIAALRRLAGPTVLALSRQNLPVLDRRVYPPASRLARGAYVLWQSAQGVPDLILAASGSEVHLALAAARELNGECNVRVVSMPSWELFEEQSPAYRDEVFPAGCTRRLAIEAGSSMGWERYTGAGDRVIGMRRFGASGPCEILAGKFGFDCETVVRTARALLAAD